MTQTAKAPKRSDKDPASVNMRYVPHVELSKVDVNYYLSHALVSFDPPIAQLPSHLSVSTDLVKQVWNAVDPADESWTSPEKQSAHKATHYWHAEHHINFAFRLALGDLIALQEALIHAATQLNKPTGPLDELLKKAIALQAEQKKYPDTAYTWMATVLLQLAGTLFEAQRITTADWIDDLAYNLKISIVYPVSDRTSYALEITYWFSENDQDRRSWEGEIVAGVRIGRSKIWTTSPTGDQPAVYLCPSEIATTYFRAFPDEGEQGFSCHLHLM